MRARPRPMTRTFGAWRTTSTSTPEANQSRHDAGLAGDVGRAEFGEAAGGPERRPHLGVGRMPCGKLSPAICSCPVSGFTPTSSGRSSRSMKASAWPMVGSRMSPRGSFGLGSMAKRRS
ncbi:hypothetical protein SMICM304S_03330 [Streptomyces microflavus]